MIDVVDVVTWLKNWFYDKTEVYTKSETYTKTEINSELGNKVNVAQGSGNSNKNVVTNSSGNIVTEDKPTIPTKTSDLTNDGSDGTTTYAEIDDIDETDIKATRYYTNLGITQADYQNGDITQRSINEAINTQIGTLKRLELVTVVTDANLPSASADTMNHLYVKSKTGGATGDGYDIWVTIKGGTSSDPTYAWEKIDDFDLQNLNISWDSVTNKPSTFPSEAHAHGNITSTGKIGTTGGKPVILDNQAKVSAGEFGTSSGTFAEGNHVHGNITSDGKIGSNNNYFVYTTTGGAVSSKQKIGNITTGGAIGSTANLPVITTTSGVLTTGSFGTTANTFAEGNHTHSGYVTSIALIPKGNDPTADAYNGVIRLYYGDEPS